MSLITRLRKYSWRRTSVIAGIALVVLTPLVILAWQEHVQQQYWHQLTKELMADEAKGGEEDETPPEMTPADSYVNDFKHTTAIAITSAGFSPSSITVKPRTKLIFKAADEQPHFVQVAADSQTPKFFDPKSDVTEHSLFQTKVEALGNFAFYDRYNPAATLTVTVSN